MAGWVRAASGAAGRRAGAASARPTTVNHTPVADPELEAPTPARPARTRIPRQPAPAPVIEPTQDEPAHDEPADAAADAGADANFGANETLRLITQAKNGDAEAFGVLYDRNVETVYRYVYYRVGSVALAEDLVSETFLRALRRIDSFTYQGRDVAAWFITIARNLIADHFKSGRFRLELATDDMVGTTNELASEDNPESQVLEAMTNRVLIAAIKELNSEQQECVVLRFLQGLTVSETAEAMGKNDGAIKALQYRAVKALARKLPPGSTF